MKKFIYKAIAALTVLILFSSCSSSHTTTVGSGKISSQKKSEEEIINTLQRNDFIIYLSPNGEADYRICYDLKGNSYKQVSSYITDGFTEISDNHNYIDPNFDPDLRETPFSSSKLSVFVYNPYTSEYFNIISNGQFFYRKEKFFYSYTEEEQRVDFTDDYGTCSYYLNDSSKNDCSKTQEESLKQELKDYEGVLKTAGVSEKDLLVLHDYFAKNQLVQLTETLNEEYRNESFGMHLVEEAGIGKALDYLELNQHTLSDGTILFVRKTDDSCGVMYMDGAMSFVDLAAPEIALAFLPETDNENFYCFTDSSGYRFPYYTSSNTATGLEHITGEVDEELEEEIRNVIRSKEFFFMDVQISWFDMYNLAVECAKQNSGS